MSLADERDNSGLFARWLPMRFLLLFCSLFAAFAQACDERPLRVYVSDWPPYMRLETPGEVPPQVTGIDARILKAVMAHAGCRFEWVEMPVERASKALRSGQMDLMMAASRIPSRESWARFSRPYRDEVIELVGDLGAAPRDSWLGLVNTNLRIMAPRSGWYGPAYEAARVPLIKAGRLVFMEDYDAGVAMLKAGRVDLVMGDSHALRDSSRRVGLVLSRPVLAPHRAPVHFMYSRRSVDRAVVQRLDASIQALHENGTLERLQVDVLP